MVKQLESLITDKCLRYLDDLIAQDKPIFYEHRSGSVGFSYKKGIPDTWFTVNGIHVECELKTPYGHRSTLQEKYELIFKSRNIRYICPKSFEEFKEYVDKILSENDL